MGFSRFRTFWICAVLAPVENSRSGRLHLPEMLAHFYRWNYAESKKRASHSMRLPQILKNHSVAKIKKSKNERMMNYICLFTFFCSHIMLLRVSRTRRKFLIHLVQP